MSTTHREWVRAAIADHLGLAAGDSVVVHHTDLDQLAEVARAATLNWVVAAAQENMIGHHCTEACDHD